MEESWKLLSAVALCSILAYYLYFVIRRYQAKNGLLFDPLINRFIDLKDSGSDREAYELVDKLISAPAKQNLWFWYYQRYRFRLHYGDFEGALADLSESLKLNSAKPELQLARVELLFQMDDNKNLLEEAQKLYHVWPSLTLTRILCAIAYAQNGHFIEAKEHFVQAELLLQDPKSIQPEADKSLLYFYFGFASHLMADDLKRDSYYEQSHLLRADNTYILYGAALVEYQSGKVEDAYITVQRAIIANQKNTKALNLMGEIYLKLDKKLSAREQFLISAKYGNIVAKKWLSENPQHFD